MMAATIVGFLDRHQGAASTIATLVLVVVTGYYAFQNRRMALEMKRAREAAVRPKLALDFYRLGPTAMSLSIASVGAGAAFDIRVQITYEPVGDSARLVQRWRRPVLETGSQRDLLPPGGVNDNLNRLPNEYRAIRMTGRMKDAGGREHKVDELIGDLAEWRVTMGESHERFIQADPDRRLAHAFKRNFDDHGGQVAASLAAIANVLSERSNRDEVTANSLTTPTTMTSQGRLSPIRRLRVWWWRLTRGPDAPN